MVPFYRGKVGHWRGCQRLRFQCPLSEPCLKFSFTRLSPRQSTRCIPSCHRRCHRAQAIYEAPPRYRVGRCGIAHLARGPSLRRVMLSAPIIATMTSSDFRSALHHFPGLPVIGFVFPGMLQAGRPEAVSPGPRRISHVPCCTVRAFRSHYAGGFFGAAPPRSSHPPWPSPLRQGLGFRSFRSRG